MKSLKTNTLLVLLCTIILPSCLDKDYEPNIFTEDLEYNALILREAESRGSYLNTRDFPSFLNADEIQNEISNYIIIDVRPPEHFSMGYIANSVNISNKELFDYVLNLNSGKPILLVSITGQASAYYTSLFRTYGMNNVYSLKFGIAGWNKKFEYEIKDNTGDKSPHAPSISTGGRFFDLPGIIKPQDSLSIKELFDNRIKGLFQDGFNEILHLKSLEDSQSDINTCNIGYLTSGITAYLMSSTTTDVKFDLPQPGPTAIYHPFYGINDFYSTEKLQTIPPDKIIVCYSYSGQLSAATVAYLRTLGYDAKSILFGMQYYAYTALKNNLGTGRLYTYKDPHDFPIITN